MSKFLPVQKNETNIQIESVHWEQKGEEKPTPSCIVVQFQNSMDKRQGDVKAFRERERNAKKKKKSSL